MALGFSSLFMLLMILGLTVSVASQKKAVVGDTAACITCSYTGYRCSGKTIVYCKNNCVTDLKTCPSYLSCVSGSTMCYDRCTEGNMKCPTWSTKGGADDNGWITKCVNDSWTNYRSGMKGCCECDSATHCYFAC